MAATRHQHRAVNREGSSAAKAAPGLMRSRAPWGTEAGAPQGHSRCEASCCRAGGGRSLGGPGSRTGCSGGGWLLSGNPLAVRGGLRAAVGDPAGCLGTPVAAKGIPRLLQEISASLRQLAVSGGLRALLGLPRRPRPAQARYGECAAAEGGPRENCGGPGPGPARH